MQGARHSPKGRQSYAHTNPPSFAKLGHLADRALGGAGRHRLRGLEDQREQDQERLDRRQEAQEQGGRDEEARQEGGDQRQARQGSGHRQQDQELEHAVLADHAHGQRRFLAGARRRLRRLPARRRHLHAGCRRGQRFRWSAGRALRRGLHAAASV